MMFLKIHLFHIQIKKTYNKIEANLDKLLKLEDDLYYFSIELINAFNQKDLKLLNRLINNRKNAIRKVFFDTQNLIIQNCFTHAFNNLSALDEVKELENKIEFVYVSNYYEIWKQLVRRNYGR